jgi:DNA-binding CsgD family transcriptional regulator
MQKETNKLKLVWEKGNKTAVEGTVIPDIDFDRLVSSLVSLGPFYFYVVDFYDQSLSHVSDSINDIHGFDPKTVTFDDVLSTIHPDDMNFVAQAEEVNLKFLYGIIGKENVVNYKSSYSFRSKMKDGKYAMLNHQAIVLTVDEFGGFGKSLNIHTVIEHITTVNNFTLSLIGLQDFPSYTSIAVKQNHEEYTSFSNREIEIIKFISQGLQNKEIAKTLFISEHTIKTHRRNIYKKAGCRNATELSNKCIFAGLI